MNRSVLKNILQNQYDRDQWISTLQFLTGKRDLLTVNLSPKIIEIQTQEAEKLVKYFHQIGSVKTSDGVVLPIFEIILEDNIRIEYNRVSVNEFIKKYIIKDAVKGALTTFSYDSDHEKKNGVFHLFQKILPTISLPKPKPKKPILKNLPIFLGQMKSTEPQLSVCTI